MGRVRVIAVCSEEFGPTGCPHALTFEEHDPFGPLSSQSGPACIWWGDDFVSTAPLSCSGNRGTCGADALELHPTVGILYQGAWHPEGLSPCDDTLVGTWVSTECGGCDDAACPVTLEVSTDFRATIASDVSFSGDVVCEGTSFVFFADGLTPPPDDAWAAGGYAGGDIGWTTDSLTVTWKERTWHFVRR